MATLVSGTIHNMKVHERLLWIKLDLPEEVYWPAMRYSSLSELFSDLSGAADGTIKASVLLMYKKLDIDPKKNGDAVAFLLGEQGAPTDMAGKGRQYVAKIPAKASSSEIAGKSGSMNCTLNFFDFFEDCESQVEKGVGIKWKDRFNSALEIVLARLEGAVDISYLRPPPGSCNMSAVTLVTHERLLWINIGNTDTVYWPAMHYTSLSELFTDLPDESGNFKAHILLSCKKLGIESRRGVVFLFGKCGAPSPGDFESHGFQNNDETRQFVRGMPKDASINGGSTDALHFFDHFERCKSQLDAISRLNEDFVEDWMMEWKDNFESAVEVAVLKLEEVIAHHTSSTPSSKCSLSDPKVHERLVWVKLDFSETLYWPALRYNSISELFANLPDDRKFKAHLLLAYVNLAINSDDGREVAFFFGQGGAPSNIEGEGWQLLATIKPLPIDDDVNTKVPSVLPFFDHFDALESQLDGVSGIDEEAWNDRLGSAVGAALAKLEEVTESNAPTLDDDGSVSECDERNRIHTGTKICDGSCSGDDFVVEQSHLEGDNVHEMKDKGGAVISSLGQLMEAIWYEPSTSSFFVGKEADDNQVETILDSAENDERDDNATGAGASELLDQVDATTSNLSESVAVQDESRDLVRADDGSDEVQTISSSGSTRGKEKEKEGGDAVVSSLGELFHALFY